MAINFQAIHKEYLEHRAKMGHSVPQAPAPQPQQNTSMHNMMLHAMAMTPNKEGETQGQMALRAITDHLKRVTPDVNSIHKPPQASQPQNPSVNGR